MEILERRIDGSFVVKHNGLPFHIIPEMYQELWEVVCAQEGLDPVEQAQKYWDHILAKWAEVQAPGPSPEEPTEDPVIEEPVVEPTEEPVL